MIISSLVGRFRARLAQPFAIVWIRSLAILAAGGHGRRRRQGISLSRPPPSIT